MPSATAAGSSAGRLRLLCIRTYLLYAGPGRVQPRRAVVCAGNATGPRTGPKGQLGQLVHGSGRHVYAAAVAPRLEPTTAGAHPHGGRGATQPLGRLLQRQPARAVVPGGITTRQLVG